MGEHTCSIDGCDRSASTYEGGAHGWCRAHYARHVRHGDPHHGGPLLQRPPTGGPCDVTGCAKPTIARGLCNNHYRRWRRYGEPLAGRPTPGGDTATRFWSKVDTSGDCWLWTDAPNNAGYGTFKVDGVTVMAHRFAWLLAGDDLDPALQLDHLCRVRLCVRREHLEQVTAAENLARARAAGEEGDDDHDPVGARRPRLRAAHASLAPTG